MQYRKMGRTGGMVSALGFGAMRLPMKDDKVDLAKAVRVIHRAFELGVNYIDTAYGYHGGESEVVVGKALKGWRERVMVSTKNPCREPSRTAWRNMFDTSMRRLEVDYIDFYNFHGLRYQAFEEIFSPSGIIEEALKLKAEGKVKHLSYSCHDTPANMRKLIDAGVFEAMTVQYNLLDRANEEPISHAHDKGMGVVIMGPVGGGRLVAPSEVLLKPFGAQVKSTPELALRFVLSNPNVSVAISGMNTLAMVEENVATAAKTQPLSDEERAALNELLERNKKLAELYCTGCAYCMPCPNEINIPRNLQLMNYYRVWGLKEFAKGEYAAMGRPGGGRRGNPASVCVECGACEPKCPQNIPIISRLKEVAKTLGEK